MKNHTSAAPLFASPAPPRAAAPHPWHERLWLRATGLPTIHEAERRLQRRSGFIASLTPEHVAMMDASDEFDVLGHPHGPRRTA